MCLNNILEQDHLMIKWRIILGLDFKEFKTAISNSFLFRNLIIKKT